MPLRDDLSKAYDAGAYSRERSELPLWKQSERALFLRHVKERGLSRILEVGAGTGRDSRFFANAGLEVTCIDLSKAMVALCRDKGLNATVMDVCDLTFVDASFDAVYAFNSLLHLTKDELPDALREIHRVLRPGGLFYFGTYGGSDYDGVLEDDDHIPRRFFSFYEDEHILKVTQAVFECVSFQVIEVPESHNRFAFQSMLLQRPIDPTLSREEIS